MPRPPLIEFALDDGAHGAGDDSPGPGAGRERRAPAPPGPERRRAVLPWVGCAVVLILVGVLTAPPRPSEVGPWGRVDDLTTDPQAAWSMGAAGGEIRSALIADGMLITVRESDIQGRDPSTGEVQWAEEADAARCNTDGTALVCVDADSRVLELDADTGTATTREIPDALLATRAEGGLFVLTTGERPALQRFADGHSLWSTPVHIDRGPVPFGEELTVLAGHVLTTSATPAGERAESHGSAYDARTGEWLGEGGPHHLAQAGPGAWQLTGSDGGRLFVRGADQPQQLAHVRLGYDDAWDGPDQVAISGAGAASAQEDEGRGGGVLDTENGRWRWSTEEPMVPVARVDGVVVADTSAAGLSAVQGRDAATGEVLWQRAETWLRCPCLADESTLVAVEVGFAPATLTRSAEYEDLIAVDAGTGEQRWQVDLSGETFAILTDGEHLITVAPTVLQGWNLG
ncbi:PQQ-binding-like beta-propeller repeat protein [Ruania zhangjianzhongii]|uniref:outer membrane protein assembly factor BamB family protein n=1 Tax=Ruania zhangjianzhongii TaxID=2603206 RepID=UPI0011C9C4D0|nr:PQQ-binding-like beta-propeller repeat protein [Ruania zhangjianzhongii]